MQDAHSAELSLNPNFQKKNQMQRPLHQGAKYLVSFSSRSVKTSEKYISFAHLVLISLYSLLPMSKKHSCEFYHSKLKNKHTSLKKYTSWAKLTEQKWYIFLSFWGIKRIKKTNISHPSGCTCNSLCQATVEDGFSRVSTRALFRFKFHVPHKILYTTLATDNDL